uniref:Uncharacterized protein n=1 Tax=Sipha flava TaxID=143950 RepID=A0A2S2QCU3_9HEMI
MHCAIRAHPYPITIGCCGGAHAYHNKKGRCSVVRTEDGKKKSSSPPCRRRFNPWFLRVFQFTRAHEYTAFGFSIVRISIFCFYFHRILKTTVRPRIVFNRRGIECATDKEQ